MVHSSDSSNNASNAPHHSNLPNSPVPNDDDDEPPCSGPATTPNTPAVIFDRIPDKDAVAASSNPEKSSPSNRGTAVSSTVLTTTPTFVDKERGIANITPTNRLRILFTPTHELGPSPGYLLSVKNALLYSPLNVLLLFIPVSWALHWSHQSDTVIFVVSALAIVPLAALLGLGTEQIALRTSQAVGGLLNASLGNVVELIIAGIALGKCDLDLVQSSLLGGLLSNMLLVLGMAFIGTPSASYTSCAPQLTSFLSRSRWLQVPLSGIPADGRSIEFFLDDSLCHRIGHPRCVCTHSFLALRYITVSDVPFSMSGWMVDSPMAKKSLISSSSAVVPRLSSSSFTSPTSSSNSTLTIISLSTSSRILLRPPRLLGLLGPLDLVQGPASRPSMNRVKLIQSRPMSYR